MGGQGHPPPSTSLLHPHTRATTKTRVFTRFDELTDQRTGGPADRQTTRTTRTTRTTQTETDRQTDRKTERQKDRKTERQKDRREDRQTDKTDKRNELYSLFAYKFRLFAYEFRLRKKSEKDKCFFSCPPTMNRSAKSIRLHHEIVSFYTLAKEEGKIKMKMKLADQNND